VRVDPRDEPFRASATEYLAPAVVFAVISAIEGYLPLEYYPAVYAVKAVAVTLTLFACRRVLRDLTPSWRTVAPSALIGAFVFVLWVGLEQWLTYPHLGSRVAYDPFEHLTPLHAQLFLAVRLYGMVLLVPVFEELLWRSFLIRYATTDNFHSIPPWAYSTAAFWIVTGAAAVAHTEWVTAAVTNIIYTWWMKRTQSVFAVVTAHAVTNLLLAAFILLTGHWQLW
jgi:CAAX prenyl protease-like protein